METKIHFVNWAGKHFIITVKHIHGCSDEHDNPIHDGITCCYTRWTMHDSFGHPWITSLPNRLETIIPSCIKFTIGDDLFDADNPINIDCTRKDFSTHATIKMSCSLGCHDFYADPADEHCDENLGVYSPIEIESMLERALRHAKKHADIRATREFDANIRLDGVHDIRLKESGLYLKDSGYYECCMGDKCLVCKTPSDDFQVDDFDTMSVGGMSLADAKKHHEFYLQKTHSEILASSLHPRIGGASPVGIVDENILTQILSLTQS